MKIGAAIAVTVLLAGTLLSGCPKSTTLIENSQEPGNVLTQESVSKDKGELTTGDPPTGK